MTLDALGHDTAPANLADLRRSARAGEASATREVAQQFEALFVQMMIKQMRDAMPTDGGLFGGGEQMKLYESMHDQQLALAMSQRGGIGLADAIERQLRPGGLPAGSAAGLATGDEPRPLHFPTHRLPARHAPLVSLERHTALQGARSTAGTRPAPMHGPAAAPPTGGYRPPASPAEFVQRMMPHARRAAARLGVAPEVLVAQSALETGWGRHVMRDADGRSSHNLFGIKATGGWRGDSVRVSTLEYRDGTAQRETAAFRGYPDEAASFADYVRLVGNNPRYQQAVANAASPEAYLRGLQEAGYATDPAYADKILSILERGLPGLSGSGTSGAPLNLTGLRPTTPPTGDPEIARVRPHLAGKEST